MQDQALNKVQQFYLKRRRIPNYKEMQKLFNNPPCTAVAYSVFKWKQAGILAEVDQGLKPTSKFFGLPLLGTIKAGYPTAEDGYLQRMLLQDYLIENPKTSYLLQINHGGLLEAGINAGDVVIVDKSKKPKSGDIIASRFGNEWLLSYHEVDKPTAATIQNRYSFSLKMKNSDLDRGVVVSVIRKYR